MAKSLREQFGRDVREARLRAGLSQTEVGTTTGKGQTYVSEIELGLRISPSTRCFSSHKASDWRS